ncbi:MAG TPA: hypothetical protein VGF61_20265, partial [Candidatus Acidoferrum sp.]
RSHYTVPRYTELRIRDLCTEALDAKTHADFERAITELRAALEEHIHLAKDSLQAQVNNFPLLSSVAQKSQWKK